MSKKKLKLKQKSEKTDSRAEKTQTEEKIDKNRTEKAKFMVRFWFQLLMKTEPKLIEPLYYIIYNTLFIII